MTIEEFVLSLNPEQLETLEYLLEDSFSICLNNNLPRLVDLYSELDKLRFEKESKITTEESQEEPKPTIRFTFEMDALDAMNFASILQKSIDDYTVKVLDEMCGENRPEMIEAYKNFQQYEEEMLAKILAGQEKLS